MFLFALKLHLYLIFYSPIAAEEIDEIAFEIEGGKRHNLEWPDHGLRLSVPADALPTGMISRLTVKALLDDDFVLPENSTLITAIYQIDVSEPFRSFITLYLQHCAVIESDAQSSEFQFVVGKSSQPDSPCPVKVMKGGVFPPYSQEAHISVKQFSRLGAIGRKHSKFWYFQQLFYKQFQGIYPWKLDFVLTRHIATHIDVSVHVCAFTSA